VKTFITLLSLTIVLFCSGAVCARGKAVRSQGKAARKDGFSGIKCGSDVARALIGSVGSNERVAVIEARHKDIGLQDLGATEINDQLSSISWKICDGEYMVLEDKRNVVRDAIKVPEHSKKWPESLGECEMNGKKMPGTILAILNNEEGKNKLSARAAWKIDEKTAKFIKLPTEGLRCSREGIFTADGGQ
jgi:hypothetical protein